MAKYGVSLKIDVTKIDKARLFEGKKGKYLDATVFIDVDEKDEYENNGMITQDVTKEERDQKVQGNILGNCKVFWSDDSPSQPKQSQNAAQSKGPIPEGIDTLEDDIPFSPRKELMA